MTALTILAAGPLCTLQDAGRNGYLAQGITPAGPMDWLAHAEATQLAANPEASAAIEIGPGGLALTTDAPVRLGLSARGFRVLRDGSALPSRAAITLNPGQRLDITPGPERVWAYLSPAGGFDEPPVMGSLSTHLRSGLGPAALAPGRRLRLIRSAAGEPECAVFAPPQADIGAIRFTLGPQDDHFTPQALRDLAACTWRIGPRSDRMAYRLDGLPLTHAQGHDIVSDGVALGAIQVPGDGLPLILMADRQPTGGYPKPGCVIRADLPRLAQLRAGETLRLAPVSQDQALAAWAAARARLAELPDHLRPMRRWTTDLAKP